MRPQGRHHDLGHEGDPLRTRRLAGLLLARPKSAAIDLVDVFAEARAE